MTVDAMPSTPVTDGHESSLPSSMQAAAAPNTPRLPDAGQRPSMGRNISVLAGSQFVSWCATLAWTLVVPRRLGAGEMGVYTIGQAAAGILLVVVGLGLRPLLVREIAADPSRAPKLLGASIVLRALLSVPALAIVTLVAVFGQLAPGEGRAVVIGWAICVVLIVSEPILAALQAMEHMRYLAYSVVLTNTGVSVGTIALAFAGVQAAGLLLVSVAMYAILVVMCVAWIRPYSRIDWRVTAADLRALFVESLPYSSFALFFTIYLWIDALLLGFLTPSTVLGWYGLPTRLFGSLMVVPVILATATLPKLVRAHEEDAHTLLPVARPTLELALILSMPICVGTVLISASLVHALYGGGFEGSVPVLALLALCVPPMYLNIMANQVLIARRQQVVWTKVMVLASVLNPALNLVLVPVFQRARGNGAIGAALAMVVTEAVIGIIALHFVRAALGRESLVRLLKAAGATAAMAAAVVPALRVDLAAGIAAGTVVFPIAASMLRVLDDEERAQVAGVVRRVRDRLRRASV